MKFIPHASAISLLATQSMAGGLADSIVETLVAEPEAVAAPAGSSDWIIPALIFGALVAVAVSGSDDDEPTEQPPSEPPVIQEPPLQPL